MCPDWEIEFFRGVALDFWRLAVSPEQTRAEVDFLEKVLHTHPSARLLDVPCGNGRHSLELARRGHRVTGVDLSREFIAEAQSARGSLAATFVLSDMRQLPWRAEFDGAFCFGNSFGYLDAQKAREFLGAVARTLKPGARFVIDTGMAAESILPGLLQKRWHKLGDFHVLSENQYHPREGRLDIQYTFIRDGRTETRPTSSYVLTANEICRLLGDAGLQPLELLGSFDGEPYRIGSPRLILVSERGTVAD
jgi:SAM-dependent methyltransferase